jgi:signal transduction histidine kinase
MANEFSADIAAVNRIPAVPTILDVVCRATGMGFAAIARVTEDRWIACSVRDEIEFGLKAGGELKVETTLCHEIRESQKPVIIDHVADDKVYSGHHTPALYGFQSYISMPIILPDGRFFGTLCAIDPRPARLNTPETIGMFKLFAELIAFYLDALERLASSESKLLEEREVSELREQFIAVLGHDLRNPLTAIAGGAELLALTPLGDRASRLVRLIQGSAARMSGLIDNLLDFARGRLGGGVTLNRKPAVHLGPVLEQVVAELRAASPHRTIETRFDLTEPVNCDSARIAQLFSNLLGNAIMHGTANTPVQATAVTVNDVFELSVSNLGDPISAAVMEHLFQPFFRGAVKPSQQGLGLGLYIASEIARAHGGTLVVDSSIEKTSFTLRLPLNLDP